MILNIPPTLSQIRAGNLRVPLQFNADLTSQYDSTKTQILSNGTSGVNLLLGVSTSGFILLKSGITNLFAAGSAQGVQNQNSWGVGVYGCNVGGSSYSGFSSTGLSDILGNVPTGSSYKLGVQGIEKYRFAAALAEMDRLSLGGTIGSSVDPGAGGLGLTNRIQFSGVGTADATKTLIYADANAGSIFINCPTSKAIQLLYNGGQKFYVDSSGAVAAGHFYVNQNQYFNGAGAASSTLTTEWADAANGNKFSNVPTGKYEQHRISGQSILKLGNNSSGTGANYWEIGDSTTPSNYIAGSNTIQSIYASGANYLASPQHRFCSTAYAETARITSASGFLEAGKISLGGTIGSSADPGAGGIYAAGNINFRGGQKCGVAIKTTTYTATSADYIILGNHASTPFTINLPTATGSGQIFIIKNINTAAVTVDANASETIDGSLTQVLAVNNSITIVDYATGLWAIV